MEHKNENRFRSFTKGLLLGLAGLSVVVATMFGTWAWHEVSYLIIIANSFISTPIPFKIMVILEALVWLLAYIIARLCPVCSTALYPP